MKTLLEKINSEKCTTLRLSDYINIKHGFAFKGEYFSITPTQDVLITPGNFAIGGGFKADKFKYYKGAIPSDYILKEGDLVVTMTDLSVNADTLGYSALIPGDSNKKFLHNQRVGLVEKKKEGIDFGYLYYLMRTRPYQKYVVSTASGSTVKHTSPDRITGYEYEFPSQTTQQKIASILGAYDKKIENNNKIIRNIERTAQTLFNEWFVNFRFPGYEKTKFVDSEMGEIPEEWNFGSVTSIFEINPVTRVKDDDEVPFVEMRDLSESGMSFMYEQKRKPTNGSRFKNHDTLIARITPCLENGKSGYVACLEEGEVGAGSTEFIVLRPRDVVFREFTYLLARNESFRSHAISRMIGSSGRQRVSGDDIGRFEFVKPTPTVIEEFHRIVSPMFSLIKRYSAENTVLKSQRDQLLAKLI